jgi:hypothetical protein
MKIVSYSKAKGYLDVQSHFGNFIKEWKSINRLVDGYLTVIQRALLIPFVISTASTSADRNSDRKLGLLKASELIKELGEIEAGILRHKKAMLDTRDALISAYKRASELNCHLRGINLETLNPLIEKSRANAIAIPQYLLEIRQVKNWDKPEGTDLVNDINNLAVCCWDAMHCINIVLDIIKLIRPEFVFQRLPEKESEVV